MTTSKEKLEKAYGACHNCYGKGYHTKRVGTISRYGNHIKDTIGYCTCERGKQLEQQVNQLINEHAKQILKEVMDELIDSTVNLDHPTHIQNLSGSREVKAITLTQLEKVFERRMKEL